MLAKCARYHAWGLPFCWVVDLEKRVVWEYPAAGEPTRIDTSGKVAAGDVTVSVADLFSQLKG